MPERHAGSWSFGVGYGESLPHRSGITPGEGADTSARFVCTLREQCHCDAATPGVAVILVALGLGAVGVESLAAAPASAAVTEPVRRVLILSLPNVVWRDLDAPDLPNLSQLLDTAAVANLSTRAPSLDADLASGYATLGSGDKAVSTGSDADGAAFDASEPIGAETAGDVFAAPQRRTGHRRPGAPRRRRAHRGQSGEPLARAHLGALGDVARWPPGTHAR